MVVGRALVSSAVRTRETWDAVAQGAGWAVEATYSDGLYAAEQEAALDLIRETPSGATTLLVLGHNPTVASLAQLLDDGDGDADASAAMLGRFSPGALTVFDVTGEWADLELGTARVRAFHVGRA